MDTMLEPGVRLEPPGLLLTRERLDEFLEEMRRKGLLTSTLDTYRRNIAFLYDALPEDKTLRPGTLDRWQRDLLAEGYSPRTVNTRLSVANHLVSFCGRRELQSRENLEISGERMPEITRAEYLRLLSTARQLGKERLYLLVKLFGSTDLSVGELDQLTAEALRGEAPCPARLPGFLRQELLNYARRQGIASGPLFCTKKGNPLGRTAVTDSMKQLCRDARVSEEKANPRCLKRLWQATQDSVRAQLDTLVEQACNSLLETEQLSIGWDSSRGVRGP